MTDVPTTNLPSQTAVEFIQNLIDRGEKAAEGAIIADIPALGIPVLKQIWEFAFDWLVKWVLYPVATLGGFIVVDAEEYCFLLKAIKAQADLEAAKKIGDANAITNASNNVDNAAANVIHYIGASK